MNFKKYIFELALVSIVLNFSALTVSGASKNMSLVDSAQLLLVKQDYDGAKKLLDKHLQVFPQDNNALYLGFAVEQTKILDYESYILMSDTFLSYAQDLKEKLENRLKTLTGRDSLMCAFYIANVSGGIGIMQAKTGKWIEAAKEGVLSAGMFGDICKADSNFYAAYFGVGVFDYYLSTSFKWVPFVSKRGKDGIKNIEIALKADFPYNYAAKNSLCWIFIERKRFKEADSLAHSVLKEFPGNTIFLRIRALISLWTGQYRQAIRFANKLIDISEKRNPVNWSDIVAGYMILACGNDRLGLPDEACKAATDFMQVKVPESYLEIPHIKDSVKDIMDVLNKSNKK